MEVLAVLAAIAIGAAIIAVRRDRRRRQHDSWYAAGRELGLRLSFGSFFREPTLEGSTPGGGALRVRSINRGKQGHFTRYHLKHARIPASLSVGKEGLLRNLLGGNDVATGDAGFDAEVRVLGDPDVVAALFDQATRARARELVAAGLGLAHGELELEHRGVAAVNARSLPGVADLGQRLRSLSALADGLAVAVSEWPARLARNAIQDPEPGVRRRCLERLGLRPDWELIAQATARQALADRDPAVRLTAARALGAEGSGVALALVRDSRTPAELRASALLLFATHAPRVEVQSLLASLEPELEELPEPLLAALARAHGRLGDAASEALLLRLLGSEQAMALRVAAAEALAGIGTVLSVEPLLALAGRFAPAGELREAAAAALAAVRGRLGDVEAGTLSLASPDGGAGGLSLEETRSGSRLSLVVPAEACEDPEPPGQRPGQRRPVASD